MQRGYSGIPLIFFGLGVLSTLGHSSVVVHVSGIETYTEDYKSDSEITVSGGEATFTGSIRSNVIVSVTGGSAIFNGNIQNNSIFNLSGGVTIIDTLKNNAEINVSGNAQLTLAQEVGNTATVQLEDAAVLVLEADNIFAQSSELNALGGTILTNGNDVSFDTVVISGNTIIDLGSTAGAVDLGTISIEGSGEILFTNWSVDTEIYFDETSSIEAASKLVFDGAESNTGSNVTSPVPEPAQTVLLMVFFAGLAVVTRRAGFSRKSQP